MVTFDSIFNLIREVFKLKPLRCDLVNVKLLNGFNWLGLDQVALCIERAFLVSLKDRVNRFLILLQTLT